MIDYQYTYLVGNLGLLILWLILFFWRKDIRKEMLIISIIFGIAGLLVEPIYILDWWKPLTITNTAIGLEDFLFGFIFGGIAAVIYEEIFKKKIKIRKTTKKKEERKNINFLILISVVAVLFFGSFFIFNINSFYSTLIAFIVGILILWIQRKDLIIDSIATGILILLLPLIGYNLLELISPGFIQTFWYFRNIPEIIILNVPLEEIIWFFLAGAYIGPLYEYWQEARLTQAK